MMMTEIQQLLIKIRKAQRAGKPWKHLDKRLVELQRIANASKNN
jgi:hypothetical protein